MPTINFVNEKKRIQVPQGANLRKEAIKAGVTVYNGINGVGAAVNKVLNCHGFGHCGTCRVRIVKGQENAGDAGTALTRRWLEKFTLRWNPLALGWLAYIGNEETMRLACRVTVDGDMDVQTKPEINLTGENFFS